MELANDTHFSRLFDFRSPAFESEAGWLAAVTGQALWRCRQELFIAEGVVEEALGTLSSRQTACPGSHRLQ